MKHASRVTGGYIGCWMLNNKDAGYIRARCVDGHLTASAKIKVITRHRENETDTIMGRNNVRVFSIQI
jgi:hypothetical protein